MNMKTSKKLLFSITKKDFDISYYSGTGAGGQHRNRHKNCVRIKHKETGIIATGADSKSLLQNKKNAFKRLVANKQFKQWLKIKASSAQMDLQEIERKVNIMMREENLKIEYI